MQVTRFVGAYEWTGEATNSKNKKNSQQRRQSLEYLRLNPRLCARAEWLKKKPTESNMEDLG
ncbi:hypothetical protein DP117_13335 [Brasilonema sp. UFV-L1]|nr:hypothetical protein [Brasilonema sp. UFV-L1]